LPCVAASLQGAILDLGNLAASPPTNPDRSQPQKPPRRLHSHPKGPDAICRSPFPLITSLQTQRFHTITHSFAQRRRAISLIFNRFRTLSIATGGYPPSAIKFRVPTRPNMQQRPRLFADPKEATATNKAARYSKNLGRSTFFTLSSTSRLPARVPHPRCDPQHLSTCGRLGDEITGCFSEPAA
jgi:hypothetical protein